MNLLRYLKEIIGQDRNVLAFYVVNGWHNYCLKVDFYGLCVIICFSFGEEVEY